MLSLKGCAVGADGVVTATYVASVPGSTEDAVPQATDVVLVAHADGAVASVSFEAPAAETEDAAFDMLAEELEALARTLRSRGEPKLGVPVYG